jgi:hypothetical protein
MLDRRSKQPTDVAGLLGPISHLTLARGRRALSVACRSDQRRFVRPPDTGGRLIFARGVGWDPEPEFSGPPLFLGAAVTSASRRMRSAVTLLVVRQGLAAIFESLGLVYGSICCRRRKNRNDRLTNELTHDMKERQSNGLRAQLSPVPKRTVLHVAVPYHDGCFALGGGEMGPAGLFHVPPPFAGERPA